MAGRDRAAYWQQAQRDFFPVAGEEWEVRLFLEATGFRNVKQAEADLGAEGVKKEQKRVSFASEPSWLRSSLEISWEGNWQQAVLLVAILVQDG